MDHKLNQKLVSYLNKNMIPWTVRAGIVLVDMPRVRQDHYNNILEILGKETNRVDPELLDETIMKEFQEEFKKDTE